MSKTILGVGINDLPYKVHRYREGKEVWVCPFYKVWRNMLMRCYSDTYAKTNPSYVDTFVCKDWLIASNFVEWMSSQNWEDRQLDKDLFGNKEYNPEVCVFLPREINTYMCGEARVNSKLPPGVSIHGDKYRVYVRNPFLKRNQYLGTALTPDEGFIMWNSAKGNLVLKLLKKHGITDARILRAFRDRYRVEP